MSSDTNTDPSGTTAEPQDPFHEHLDACEQCRGQPFNLCAMGMEALEKAAKAIEDKLTIAPTIPPYMRRLPRWP